MPAVQAEHTWVRLHPQTLVNGVPLMPPVQARIEELIDSACPQLAWIEVPELVWRQGHYWCICRIAVDMIQVYTNYQLVESGYLEPSMFPTLQLRFELLRGYAPSA